MLRQQGPAGGFVDPPLGAGPRPGTSGRGPESWSSRLLSLQELGPPRGRRGWTYGHRLAACPRSAGEHEERYSTQIRP